MIDLAPVTGGAAPGTVAAPSAGYGPLAVIKEMLAGIETSTMAGQLYVMGKVIAELQRELGRQGELLAESQRRMLTRGLENLSRQISSHVPDVCAFVARAGLVVETLAGAR
jgi:hypothetical protein